MSSNSNAPYAEGEPALYAEINRLKTENERLKEQLAEAVRLRELMHDELLKELQLLSDHGTKFREVQEENERLKGELAKEIALGNGLVARLSAIDKELGPFDGPREYHVHLIKEQMADAIVRADEATATLKRADSERTAVESERDRLLKVCRDWRQQVKELMGERDKAMDEAAELRLRYGILLTSTIRTAAHMERDEAIRQAAVSGEEGEPCPKES